MLLFEPVGYARSQSGQRQSPYEKVAGGRRNEGRSIETAQHERGCCNQDGMLWECSQTCQLSTVGVVFRGEGLRKRLWEPGFAGQFIWTLRVQLCFKLAVHCCDLFSSFNFFLGEYVVVGQVIALTLRS